VTYSAREAELWSTKDYGNFVDLAAAAPSPPLAPKEEEEEDWEFSGTTPRVATVQTATTTTPSIFFLFELGTLLYKLARNQMKSNDDFCVSKF
jgi:hypothetical protein